MARAIRRKSSSLELGTATRQQLGYIIKHSETVVTVVGAIRALAKKYKQLVQLEAQVAKQGNTLVLVVQDKEGEFIQTFPTDFKL